MIIIAGATASGKSELALKLAEQCNGIVIAADSMQIYRGLPILSAQPSENCVARAEHRLYGTINPEEDFSCSKWLDLVRHEIRQDKVPIIVGGTGLYIKALLYGLSPMPKISSEIKTLVAQELATMGLAHIASKVIDNDPRLQIKQNDKQRILRAYEILLASGQSILSHQEQNKPVPLNHEYEYRYIELPRHELYENINKRFELMLSLGVIDEVRDFCRNHHDWQKLRPSSTLGFTEIAGYIAGKLSYHDMIIEVQKKTRQYAKRQLTWFRHQI